MRTTGLSVAALALLSAGASAKTIKVEVGESGDTYSPDTITAAKGDVVEFHFNSMHDVVVGPFNKPCEQSSSGGFYSGMLPSGKNSYFSVTVNTTDPIFFYCSVGDHCQEGMVGVINEGSNKLSSYKSAAEKTDSSSAPKNAYNGTVAASAASGSSSSSASASASASGSTNTGSATSSGTSTGTSTSTSTSTDAASTSNAAGQLSGSIAGASYFGLLVAGALAL